MKKFLFFIIILIAAFLRLYQLGNVPPSPDWDEAALGYNAYSILKTGRDEFGNFLPLSIRSFDDYKPPLYTYLTVPSVGLFGLTVWSTRLPSALMGILAVIGTYFLVQELLRFSKFKEPGTRNQELMKNLPLLSAALLAISPWHIQFSRIAFEANIGVTVNIWALVFFFMGLRKKTQLLFSAFLFGLGFYAYHSERVFLPLLLLLLFCLFRKELFSAGLKKTVGLGVVIGLVTIAPLLTVTFSKTAFLRLKGTSSLSDQVSLLKRTANKIEEDKKAGNKIGELIDNRRFVFVKTVLSGYLSHFSLRWLFMTGDNPRHHAPDMGLLYIWELPFLLYGIVVLARFKGKLVGFLFGWILIAPVAASPTSGLPHAIRTLVFLPVPQILTSMGLLSFLDSISSMKGTRFIPKRLGSVLEPFTIGILSIIILFNFFHYFTLYFVFMNREYSQYWQYGMKEAVEYTESVKDKYKKIVVSTRLEQSYMFYLFYLKYDPKKYLAQGGTKSGGFAEEHNAFDKYEFRWLFWDGETFDGNTLYVGSSIEMPHGNNAHITYLDGTPAIEIKDRKD